MENPYWPHFCGETYFQHQPPIDPSSLTRWRQRIGEEGVEWLLSKTIEAARRGKQYRRMRASLKSFRTLVGRVWRDIDRKRDRRDELQNAKAASILARVKRLLEQKPKVKNKLYNLHAPEVKCISVDRGYRGIAVDGVTIWRSGQKRGVAPSIRRAFHRRSAVEPAFGHMKNEGKLRRHWLKGSLGDALNAVLCRAGHNLRMTLRTIRLFYVWMLGLAIAAPRQQQSPRPDFRRFAAL